MCSGFILYLFWTDLFELIFVFFGPNSFVFFTNYFIGLKLIFTFIWAYLFFLLSSVNFIGLINLFLGLFFLWFPYFQEYSCVWWILKISIFQAWN